MPYPLLMHRIGASEDKHGSMFSFFRKGNSSDAAPDALADVPRSIPQEVPTDRENIETHIISECFRPASPMRLSLNNVSVIVQNR